MKIDFSLYPWTFKQVDTEKCKAYKIYNKEDVCLGIIWQEDGMSEKEVLANARIISHAPEIFTQAIRFVDALQQDLPQEFIDQAMQTFIAFVGMIKNKE